MQILMDRMVETKIVFSNLFLIYSCQGVYIIE